MEAYPPPHCKINIEKNMGCIVHTIYFYVEKGCGGRPTLTIIIWDSYHTRACPTYDGVARMIRITAIGLTLTL